MAMIDDSHDEWTKAEIKTHFRHQAERFLAICLLFLVLAYAVHVALDTVPPSDERLIELCRMMGD